MIVRLKPNLQRFTSPAYDGYTELVRLKPDLQRLHCACQAEA